MDACLYCGRNCTDSYTHCAQCREIKENPDTYAYLQNIYSAEPLWFTRAKQLGPNTFLVGALVSKKNPLATLGKVFFYLYDDKISVEYLVSGDIWVAHCNSEKLVSESPIE